MLNHKQLLDQRRFTELLGVAGAAPPLPPQQLPGHAEGNSDSVVELMDGRQQPSTKEQLCDLLTPNVDKEEPTVLESVSPTRRVDSALHDGVTEEPTDPTFPDSAGLDG